MARVNGRSPVPPTEPTEEEYRPPHYPWVLLCDLACGWVRTVNRQDHWKDAVRARAAHSKLCTYTPAPLIIFPGTK